MYRIAPIVIMLCATASSARGGEIYLRDGVTDGDTFYLADVALHDDDPALQSWVSYSLTRSTCQLQIGGENPARANSFECELIARRHLLETWQEQQSDESYDEYLNELLSVEAAGYLPEYVAHYFGRRGWTLPADLQMNSFREWRRKQLRGHKPRTRWIGSWNYADKVQSTTRHR